MYMTSVVTGVVDDDYSGTLSITSTAVSYEHIELVWSIVGNSEPKNAIFIVQISDSDDSSFETVYCGHDTQTTGKDWSDHMRKFDYCFEIYILLLLQ